MAINFKKVLLTGTALVAASFFATQAQAAAFVNTATAITSGATGTWANTTNGVQGQATHATIATAGRGDSVNLDAGATLTVTNNGTADDGSANANTFDLGAVTNTAGTGVLLIQTGGANDLTVTGTSFSVGGNATIQNQDANGAVATVTFSGAGTVGGNFAVTNNESNAAKAVSATIGGALTVTGTTAVVSGTHTGAATAQLTVTGNAALTDNVTVTASANNANNTAILLLNGATNALASGTTKTVTLTDTTAGLSYLTFNGSTAQTVSGGDIKGGGAGQGTIIVNNASGVTFSNTIGAGNALAGVVINKGAGNATATFKAAVSAPITLGAAAGALGGQTFGVVTAGDTNTAVFDGTTAAFTVTGVIAGQNATQTNKISVVGGRTITFVGASTANLHNLDISASGTNASFGANNFTLTTTGAGTGTTTIGTGSTLTVTGNNFTSPIVTVGGTVAMTGGTITGVLDGSAADTGTLAVTGTAVVTGNIGTTKTLSAVTVATGNSLEARGDLKAAAITLSGTGALSLTTGATHSVSAISANADGDGSVTVADVNGSATTFTGDIGSSSKKIASMTITNGAGVQTINLAGNHYVNATTLNVDDTLRFTGTSAQTVSGTILGGAAGRGILTVGNGTDASAVTFNGIIGATTLASATIAAKSSATFNENVSLAGAFGNAGTMTVKEGKTVTAGGAFTGGASNTINLNLLRSAGANSIGKMNITAGGAVSLANTTLNINVQDTSQILVAGNSAITTVIGGNTGAATTAASVTDNSYLYGFALRANGNGFDLDITNANTMAATAVTGGNLAVGNVLQTTLVGSTNAGINAMQGSLQRAATQTAVNETLESFQPTVDGSATVTAMNVGAQVQGLADTRIASLRSGDALSGVAAGATANGWSMWLQGYGQHGEQDADGGIDGYDADTWGAAVGVDTTSLTSNSVIGISFNYGNTSADSKNANTTDTDVDNFGVNLYGSYDLGQQYFMNGQVGYAYNDINIDRHNVTGPGLGVTAFGDTNSDQWMAKLGFGRDFAQDHGLTLTPTISASYVHLNTDGYTETGTGGGANLIVASNDMDSLQLALGLNAAWAMKNADGTILKPALRVGYAYEAIADEVDVNSAFVGDAAATAFRSTGPSADRSAFNVGAGVTYMTTANWDLTANYDYTMKSNYDGHAGILRATSHF